jgi:adenylosuccinate lyase
MLANIYRTKKVIFAQRVMNALIERGFVREEAYDTVQPIAMRAWGEGLDYQELLAENEKVMSYLTREELDACFTLEYYLKNVDFIFDRVGIE